MVGHAGNGGSSAPAVAPASLACRDALGADLLASSRSAGWTSLLVDHHRIEPTDGAAFETAPTPDQTIVVMLRGEQQLEVANGRSWRRACYQAGTVGLTPGGGVDRLRRRVLPRVRFFEKANLYVPTATFRAVADHYRRAGQQPRGPGLNALAFADPLLPRIATTLLAAAAAGAPDFYAEAAAQWLATHLLSFHAQHFHAIDTERRDEPLTDGRLRRVLDLMAARLADALTLDELAAEAGLSKFHFVRLFRAKVGSTPQRLLTRMRVEAAQTMLAGTDLDIAAVAARCGFARPSSFTSAFSRVFGVPPSQWRAHHR